MNFFMVVIQDECLMSGTFERVLGVFSSRDKAFEVIKTEWNFSKAEKMKENSWRYIMDGEMTTYFDIEEITIDKKRGPE